MKVFIFCRKQKKVEEKNAIILVLPIEEISLRPELSSPSPPRFRIQGGWCERESGRRTGGGRTNGNPSV